MIYNTSSQYLSDAEVVQRYSPSQLAKFLLKHKPIVERDTTARTDTLSMDCTASGGSNQIQPFDILNFFDDIFDLEPSLDISMFDQNEPSADTLSLDDLFDGEPSIDFSMFDLTQPSILNQGDEPAISVSTFNIVKPVTDIERASSSGNSNTLLESRIRLRNFFTLFPDEQEGTPKPTLTTVPSESDQRMNQQPTFQSNQLIMPEVRSHKYNTRSRSRGEGGKDKQTLIGGTVEKPFEYGTCGQKFSRSASLKGHRRTHVDEEPLFWCHTRDRKFSRKKELRKHCLKHSVGKSFEYETDGPTFSYNSFLVHHNHTPVDEIPFLCDTCGKTYSSKVNLKMHIRIHTGEKPFECDTCGRKFSRKWMMVRHNRSHTDENPFECDTCGRKFSQKILLVRHNYAHTGENPFKCDMCGRKFSQKSTLAKHNRTHTGEKLFE